MRIDRSGMGIIHAELDLERYDQFRTAIDREVSALAASAKKAGDQVTKDGHLAADALISLVDRGNASDGGTSRPLITLIVDERTATIGPHENSVRETSYGNQLPPVSIQRHLCDSVIQPVRLSDGLKLKVGWSSRTATAAQWVALKAIHATCAWDGCIAPVEHCQAHHVRHWEQGGQTDIDNLAPLCSRHHHRVHEQKWGLRLKPGRQLEIIRPDGVLWRTTHPDRLDPERC